MSLSGCCYGDDSIRLISTLVENTSSVSEWPCEEGAHRLFLLLLLFSSLQLQSVHPVLLRHAGLLWSSRWSRWRAAQCGEEAGHGNGAPQQAHRLCPQSPSTSPFLPCTPAAPKGQRSVLILHLLPGLLCHHMLPDQKTAIITLIDGNVHGSELIKHVMSLYSQQIKQEKEK